MKVNGTVLKLARELSVDVQTKQLQVDPASEIARKQLMSLFDPKRARAELDQGLATKSGEVLTGKTEAGTKRAELLERVANGEVLTEDEFMGEVEAIKRSAESRRMIWDGFWGNIIASIKSPKREW